VPAEKLRDLNLEVSSEIWMGPGGHFVHFDRLPLERWTRGRVTLLGDACHPMLPFMAQGAAQAIEDGATLTACLADSDDEGVPEALRRYETLRRSRATRLQEMSAANKIRFHLPDGPEQERRDAEMAGGSTDWSVGAVAWLYGHDARELDQAGSPATGTSNPRRSRESRR
jgi:salicylate hydroxylase